MNIARLIALTSVFKHLDYDTTYTNYCQSNGANITNTVRSTMQATTGQIKALHAVLPKDVVKDPELKAQFVYSVTNDATRTSTKSLTFDEANDALVSMGANPHKKPFVRLTRWHKFDYKKDSHMYILSLLQQMDWKVKSQTSNRYFADMNRFADWLQSKKSPVNKSLLDMNAVEVSTIISALENMVKHHTKKTLQQ